MAKTKKVDPRDAEGMWTCDSTNEWYTAEELIALAEKGEVAYFIETVWRNGSATDVKYPLMKIEGDTYMCMEFYAI